MSNVLSSDTIKKLLKGVEPKKKDSEPLATSYKERWPGEANLVKLAKAVRRGAEFVLFRNGKRFSITYVNENRVLLKPTEGFVPMGFFSRQQLREAELTGIDPEEK